MSTSCFAVGLANLFAAGFFAYHGADVPAVHALLWAVAWFTLIPWTLKRGVE